MIFGKTFIIPVGLIYMRNVLLFDSFLCQLFCCCCSYTLFHFLPLSPSSPPSHPHHTRHYHFGVWVNFSTLFSLLSSSIFSHYCCCCQVMKQSIKELCYELFFLQVPPSLWAKARERKQHQHGGRVYKLILFNLNLFIAKNFSIMRFFCSSFDVCVCVCVTLLCEIIMEI